MIVSETRSDTVTSHSPSVLDRVLESLDTRKRVLVFGDSHLAGDLIRILTTKRRHRYEVVGLLVKSPTLVGSVIGDRPVIGTVDRLFEIVEQQRISTIAICVEDRRGTMPLDTLLDLKSMGIFFRKSWTNTGRSGRGPTRLISPLSTLNS